MICIRKNCHSIDAGPPAPGEDTAPPPEGEPSEDKREPLSFDELVALTQKPADYRKPFWSADAKAEARKDARENADKMTCGRDPEEAGVNKSIIRVSAKECGERTNSLGVQLYIKVRGRVWSFNREVVRSMGTTSRLKLRRRGFRQVWSFHRNSCASDMSTRLFMSRTSLHVDPNFSPLSSCSKAA